MMLYSVQPRDRIFVKGYGFSSFATNMGKNIGKNISKKLSGKCSQRVLDHAKSATNGLKTTSKRVFQKTAETTVYSICNRAADRIKKVSSRNLQQNNLETFTNENDKKITKERYISPEKRQ